MVPISDEGADEAMRTLALCQIFQVAADDGSEAFAAAVAEYGAPAVLAGGESDEIDVSAYGFTVPDSGSGGVLSELEALTGQVRAMEEKVRVHLSQVSLVESEDVLQHRAPVGAPSANAVASDVPRQVVPRGGGASAGGALATGGYMAQLSVPTEDFPSGVDLIPVRPYVRAGHDARAGNACSFQPATDSFVEPSEAIGHYSIDEFLSDSGAEEIEESENQKSFVGTLSGRSAGRPQQAIGCGAPPHGLRPNFVLLACFLGLLRIGFVRRCGRHRLCFGKQHARCRCAANGCAPTRLLAASERGIMPRTTTLAGGLGIRATVVPAGSGALSRAVGDFSRTGMGRCSAIAAVLTTAFGS
ncbi:hypothetical protein CYMTET_20307 [Cymbomonas tetramitiformis]|uniref:Uncharacterized protein n=1 Tax=Cymbomonas tetramitiformis TaxID=36881 RepID=A0AAE0L443_9CHLO|nr:hypothetical protein CYMTET_20307 [Cymbomonas tetramitiformis]